MIKLDSKKDNITIAQKLAKGDDGGYYKPVIDDKGNLTWTTSIEGMPSAETANIAGPKGDKGESGVYLGTDEPTGDTNVWINPDGEPSLVMTKEQVQKYIDDALWGVENSAY